MRLVPEGAPILAAEAMRAHEVSSGVLGPELMQRAGVAVAREVARLAAGRPILMLAGPGKNGGDARIAAAMLRSMGVDVVIVGYDALDATMPRPVLVDGVFGIGLSRPLEDADLLHRLAVRADLVIALDLPSGLDTDTGRSLGAVRADVTIALGALKPAHVLADGVALCGHVVLDDLGIAARSKWRSLGRPGIVAPEPNAHKYSRGLVAVASGEMPGAARLAARAAMHGGAGYVVLAGGEGGPDALVHRSLDELVDDERVTALVVGPGLGRDPAAQVTLDRALASVRRLVLDGDALSLLGQNAVALLSGREAPTALTPHSGEFDRMFGVSEASKIERTLAAARATGCTIVHKGADTVIAHPDGRVTVSASAASWLASAGTGDVLAGLVAAAETPEAAVWLHQRTAALAGPALIADGLIAALPAAVEECVCRTIKTR